MMDSSVHYETSFTNTVPLEFVRETDDSNDTSNMVSDKVWSFDYLMKLLVVGESNVGKSCLLLRFTENKFNDNFISTIGVDFKISTVKLQDKIVKVQIWDTAGQERFRSITSSYYNGAHGILLVYDCTSEDSFSRIPNWYDELKMYIPEKASIVLVGNKCDLVSQKVVTFDMAKELANRLGFTGCIETSAKDCANVTEAFAHIIYSVFEHKNYNVNHSKEGSSSNSIVSAGPSQQRQLTQRKNNSNCC